MNLNLELFKKKTKDEYPKKRSMNLYYKEDTTTLPATIALYIAFVAVIVIVLLKFLVIDYVVQVNDLKHQVDDQMNQITEAQAYLADYDEVNANYVRYSDADKEKQTVNRIEILDLIDTAVRPYATVENVSVTDSVVLIQFSGTTLSQVADITANIEKSQLVSYVLVDTAKSEENANLVTANVYIELISLEPETPEETDTSSETDGLEE